MNKGYARVSTKEAMENNGFARQEYRLKDANIDIMYRDVMSGAKRERPELNRMLNELQEGDVVYIVSIDRLSRSTKDLIEIVDTITQKGAYLVSINETWLDTRDVNPMSDFLLTVLGAIAQLERDMITKRIREGVEAAQARGVRFGRPRGCSKEVTKAANMYLKGGVSLRELEAKTGVSRSAISKEARRLQEAANNG